MISLSSRKEFEPVLRCGFSLCPFSKFPGSAMRLIDLSGQRFTRLVVLERCPYKAQYWRCVCDCGTCIVTAGARLRGGITKSCGCLSVEISTRRLTTHGLSSSPEYAIYRTMMDRCYNPKTKNFHRYGGRGITVSDRWRECFENFYADMGPRPGPEYSIDRQNNELGYYTTNCHWTTGHEQSRNKQTNVRLEWEGKTYILADLAKKLGISERLLGQRLRNGMSLERAVKKPPVERYTINGLTMSIREWCLYTEKNINTVKNRIYALGLTLEEALNK